MHKYGESKTTRIMMAIVRHVTSSSGLRKFQAAWFLLNRGYKAYKFANINIHLTGLYQKNSTLGSYHILSLGIPVLYVTMK